MPKICLIQKILKDTDFATEAEQINFHILKTLSESGFDVDVFCVNDNLEKRLKFKKILKLDEEYFYQNSFSIANKMDYDLTFATDYFPTNIAYLYEHTKLYNELIFRNKFVRLFALLFINKPYKIRHIETNKQRLSALKNEIIFTPSMILKNDLINNYHIDGQKIYILPPAIEVPKNIKFSVNDVYTFGFIGFDFIKDGGLLVLQAIKELKDFDFKLKVAYSNDKIPKIVELFLKLHKLEDKVQFISCQNNLVSFYDEIDCLLMPSKKESFGIPVLEVMSRGKIVLVSSRCGAKDVIEPENNGFIFDITNNPVRNMVRNLEYILVNKTELDGMQQKAVYTASVYNFERFKTELIRVINKLIDEKTEG